MKKILVVLMLLCSTVGFAQSMSTADHRFPLPVTTDNIIAFTACATPTMTIGSVTPVALNVLPAGTKGFYITCASGLLYGNSAITCAANYPIIATATPTLFKVSPLTPQPTIYFLNHLSGATTTAYIMPFK